jgi:hypothetical protein
VPAKDLVKAEVDRLIREAKLKGLPADKKCLRNGDDSGKPEDEGYYTVSASELRRPVVRGNFRDKKTGKAVVLKPGVDDEVIYGGCWGNVLVRPWYMNNKFGKRVNANLIAVQFLKDDEAYGQGRIGEDDIDETFDEFADDDDSGYDDNLATDEDDYEL